VTISGCLLFADLENAQDQTTYDQINGVTGDGAFAGVPLSRRVSQHNGF
jgi:hypothetical protein